MKNKNVCLTLASAFLKTPKIRNRFVFVHCTGNVTGVVVHKINKINKVREKKQVLKS